MKRKKQLFIYIALCTVILSGCGRKDVIYDASSVDDQSDEATKSVDQGLSEALGIENGYRWKDTLQGKDNVSWSVDAKVTFPEVDNLYTVKTDRIYYGVDEKKAITDYFYDDGTISVNPDTATKEDLQDTKKRLEALHTTGDRNIYANDNVYKTYLDYIEHQIENAPSEYEINDKTINYDANSFIGERDGIEYTIDFFSDETTNTSAFVIQRVQDTVEFTEFYGNLNSTENICGLSSDDACEKAMKLIEAMELPTVGLVGINDLCQWYVDESGYERRSVNGYYLHYAREIDGVTVDNKPYYKDENRVFQMSEFPYLREFIDIGIDDNGLVFLRCSGILTVGEMMKVSNVLSFENVKSVISDAMVQFTPASANMSGKIKDVALVYMRIGDKSADKTFEYIPVWRICPYSVENSETVPYGDILLINAIDGSVIDGSENEVITNYNQIKEEDRITPMNKMF